MENLEEKLGNLVESGPFSIPMSLFQRMAASFPWFADAGAQILYAAGKKETILEIQSLPASTISTTTAPLTSKQPIFHQTGSTISDIFDKFKSNL